MRCGMILLNGANIMPLGLCQVCGIYWHKFRGITFIYHCQSRLHQSYLCNEKLKICKLWIETMN